MAAKCTTLLRVLTLVARSSAACPGGWTLWDDGGKCYKVTAGRFTALGCATACGENASLACIRSSEEANFTASLTRSVGNVWIGLYQSAGGAEPGGGWGTCASGEATNFSKWRDGFPSNVAFDSGPASLRSKELFRWGVAASSVVAFSAAAISDPAISAPFSAAALSGGAAFTDANMWGIGQQCAVKSRAYLRSEWFDHPCYYPYQCLCELGARPSDEYLSFIKADIEEGLQQLRWSVVFLYGIIIPAAWILTPAFFICTFLAWSRLRRSLRQREAIAIQEHVDEASRVEAISKDETHAPAVDTEEPVARASVNAVTKLADAETKGRLLRLRVSGTFVQLSWMLLCLAFFPTEGRFFGVVLTLIAGSHLFYAAALPWAAALFLLALRPTDAKAISVACAFIFFLLLLATVMFSLTVIIAVGEVIIDPAKVLGLIFAFICAWCAALVWPTLNMRFPCRAKAAETRMSPRRQLLRLWLAFRLVSFGIAILYLAICLSSLLNDKYDDPASPNAPLPEGIVFASWLITSFVFSSANRGRVVAWVGALGKSNKKENEAAVLASLVNNLSAAEAFKRGTERFRALPLAKLTPADLPGSKVLAGYSQGMSASAQPTKELCEKTYSAKLGEVDAFISHSWSDDGDAKFDRLQEWAAGRVGVSVWLDKACLDQRDITASLAGLPVFLSGCKKLLVLAGPTYASRLWCVMEIFVFVRMGGKQSDMVVRLLSGTTDLAPALLKFDAGKAETFDPNDRERLWAVIEASFGTFDPFNKVVRDMFGEKLQRGRSSHFKASPACTVTVEPDDADAAAPSL